MEMGYKRRISVMFLASTAISSSILHAGKILLTHSRFFSKYLDWYRVKYFTLDNVFEDWNSSDIFLAIV